MTKNKPFCISKWAVFSAWAQVRGNRGAAGVDNVTIEGFEKKLKNNLYPICQSHVIRVVRPAAGQTGVGPQGRRRGQAARNEAFESDELDRSAASAP